MSPEVSDPTAAAHAQQNGGATDDEVVRLLRKQIAVRQVRVDELNAELASLMPELKRYQKVLSMLSGERLGPGGRPAKDKTPKPPTPGARAGSTGFGIGEERIAHIERAIREYARDHDEFRQVDIRSMQTGMMAKSSVLSQSFEALRQRNVIRLARASGNNKYYRLTREALNAEPEA